VLTRSLVTGTVAIVGFLVLVATTELFYFGPPAGAHNAGEAFASFGGAALALLTWAVVGWCVARTARALRLARVSVLVGMVAPVAAIVAFALTVDLDSWSAGFGVLSFAAASLGVLVASRHRKAGGSGVVPAPKGHPPVRMAA
jgi:low temperature requirement protein LtrA